MGRERDCGRKIFKKLLVTAAFLHERLQTTYEHIKEFFVPSGGDDDVRCEKMKLGNAVTDRASVTVLVFGDCPAVASYCDKIFRQPPHDQGHYWILSLMRGGTNTASAKGAHTAVLVVESPRCS